MEIYFDFVILIELRFINSRNSLKNYSIVYSGKADFLVNGTYLFEVGGKNKGKQQIKN